MVPSKAPPTCPWGGDPGVDSDLDRLHAILNCASVQGCGDCAACSERALELFLKAAREQKAAVV